MLPPAPAPTPYQWLGLVGAVWLQSINSPNTDLPVYSSHLKHLLSISQLQLNNLAFASDVGKLLGWVSGLAAAHLPLWVVLIIGTTLGLVGYGTQYVLLVMGSGDVGSLSYGKALVLTAISGNGICWINTVCYLVAARNFAGERRRRRVALGITAAYSGLSAVVYTSIAEGVMGTGKGRSTQRYILLNAVVPVVVTLVTSPMTRDVADPGGNTGKPAKTTGQDGSSIWFLVLFLIALVTGIWGVMVNSVDYISDRMPRSVHAAGIAALLSLPVVVPLGMKLQELRSRRHIGKESRVHDSHIELGEIQDDMSGSQTNVVVVTEEVATTKAVKEEEEGEAGKVEDDHPGVVELLQTLEFWLYFFGYLFGPTIGMVYLNNLGQVVESRGLDRASSLVSLSSSFGFFGRLLPPMLDFCCPKSRIIISRPAFMAALTAPMAGAFFLLLSPSQAALYIGTATVGACTGATTSAAVSATEELFGSKRFGLNHNLIVANIPLGSLMFGYLASTVYRKAAANGAAACLGARCYAPTFAAWGVMTSVGTLLMVALYLRTHRQRGRDVAGVGARVDMQATHGSATRP